MSMFSAIFLDRDGVIVENRKDYIRSWADVHIFDQALTALRRAARFPIKIVIVTNQSVVGRGIISIETAWEINRRLIHESRQPVGVLMASSCAHTPLSKSAPAENPSLDCSSRQPRPYPLT